MSAILFTSALFAISAVEGEPWGALRAESKRGRRPLPVGGGLCPRTPHLLASRPEFPTAEPATEYWPQAGAPDLPPREAATREVPLTVGRTVRRSFTGAG